MRCDECDHWLVERRTTYGGDGSTVTNYRAPDGKGHCDVFDQDFDAAFFCGHFKESSWDHVEKKQKPGEPWQHWEMIRCPDCLPVGHAVGCRRCASTGLVRRYDDGYVGEEQTRLHPREKALIEKSGGAPKCSGCGKDVDVNWVACPWCGTRVHEPPAETEIVGWQAGAAEGTTNEMIQAAKERRQEVKVT